MDCDATCLATGPVNALLNLIGFLVFSAVALCVSRGSDGDPGRLRFWAQIARVALVLHGM